MNTDWSKLSFPRLCALAAQSPTKLSQAMHNAAFKELGIDFSYVAFDTADTPSVVRSMRELGIRGFSLTIPHKENALDLVDFKSEEVEAIKATNTLINDGSKIHAFNTDTVGIERAFAEAGVKSLSGKDVLLLGAGGAAKAAIYTAKKLDAKSILVANRNEERAKSLASEFQVHTVYLHPFHV